MEQARDRLRIPGVGKPVQPSGVSVGLPGVAPWETSADDFYLVHTAIIPPAIDPADWRLRIHGLVDKEVTLTYQDLLDRQLTEAWVTLNCVSNPVGGNLIGNAWWSGVRVADLLREAGVQAGADAVLQTSDDGWTCGTPVAALTDDRNAMLVVAMNGKPLPIEHGFPVRTLVPGLYGYVSACKWVVDWEVSKFEDISAYWTQRGWGELGPVKLASRIDVPGGGDDRRHRAVASRRRRLVPAHRHLGGRGLARRGRVAVRRDRQRGHHRLLGPVVRDPDARHGRPHAAGAGHRPQRSGADRRRGRRAPRRCDWLAHRQLQRRLTPGS